MKLTHLDLSDLALESSDSANHVWLGMLTIAGIYFHVMFIEVTKPNGIEAMGDGQSAIDGIVNSDEGREYQSVTYKGKPCFVVIHPFQA